MKPLYNHNPEPTVSNTGVEARIQAFLKSDLFQDSLKSPRSPRMVACWGENAGCGVVLDKGLWLWWFIKKNGWGGRLCGVLFLDWLSVRDSLPSQSPFLCRRQLNLSSRCRPKTDLKVVFYSFLPFHINLSGYIVSSVYVDPEFDNFAPPVWLRQRFRPLFTCDPGNCPSRLTDNLASTSVISTSDSIQQPKWFF